MIMHEMIIILLRVAYFSSQCFLKFFQTLFFNLVFRLWEIYDSQTFRQQFCSYHALYMYLRKASSSWTCGSLQVGCGSSSEMRGIQAPTEFNPWPACRMTQNPDHRVAFGHRVGDLSGNYGKLRSLPVAQRVERWTCDKQVVGSNPTRGKSCVTSLGKLFAPMCLYHQSV